ncbi:MAG: AlpA family phage regulatory protein [Gemmatimonadetes bacterium]|nr:AlpA family phage regulatory protein [Gemmatimonadota bacterium]
MATRQLLKISEVEEMTGLRRETIWRKVREGKFPGALRLPGSNAVRFQRSAVERFVGIAAHSDAAA